MDLVPLPRDWPWREGANDNQVPGHAGDAFWHDESGHAITDAEAKRRTAAFLATLDAFDAAICLRKRGSPRYRELLRQASAFVVPKRPVT
jgi:hypothetical protein